MDRYLLWVVGSMALISSAGIGVLAWFGAPTPGWAAVWPLLTLLAEFMGQRRLRRQAYSQDEAFKMHLAIANILGCSDDSVARLLARDALPKADL